MTIQTDAVIVGAGPCGLFQIFELGLLGIKAHIVDALPEPGGQCTALYPDKPIYDIPAIPVCTAQELVENLMEQIKPFDPIFHLDQQVARVDAIDDQTFRMETTKRTIFETKSVIIAGGVGSFQPTPLRVEGAEKYLDRQVFYHVKDPSEHYGRDLIVLGGSDSAFDWVLELADKASSLLLIHRSDKFRAAPASVARMKSLVKDGKMTFMIGNVVEFTESNEMLQKVHVRHTDSSISKHPVEHLLVFFGLSPKLGPITQWGLNLKKNQITVDTEKFETNVSGIYAIGDISTYLGKKKLILSGFHEAALAAFAIKARLNPSEKVFLQYTTTSPILHERLGVS